MKIDDMPKLSSPFIREVNDKGQYVVTPNIAPGYEWVFEDPSVMAVEKLHGTNVSIIVESGKIKRVFNRTNEVDAWNGNHFIAEAIHNSYGTKYKPDNRLNGQFFGEVIGPKLHSNPYSLNCHMWIPFVTYARQHLIYDDYHKYPKTFDNLSQWFRSSIRSRFCSRHWAGQDFCEGIVFTHPDGRMAKLRKDMFDWYYIDNPGAIGHNANKKKQQ